MTTTEKRTLSQSKKTISRAQRGGTVVRQNGKLVPKLPHEIDESTGESKPTKQPPVFVENQNIHNKKGR